MKHFELLSPNDAPTGAATKLLRWSFDARPTSTVQSNIGWGLNEFGNVSPAARDLVRIASAAYLADRLTPRGATFTRSIEITVHLSEPAAWNEQRQDEITWLLHWLTGDDWKLNIAETAPLTTPLPEELPLGLPGIEEVVLLSGGLDSLCGAADRLNDSVPRIFVSHTDGTNAVKHAQHEAIQWLESSLHEGVVRPRFTPIIFSQRESKKESSTRSRSLLFMAWAVAAASAVGAQRVVVPENGYTSINIPLTPARGGALSTRSTHPTTFHRVNELVRGLRIDVSVENPYQGLTKGRLVARAATVSLPGFKEAVARSVSCGKLDGNYYAGGNANYNCGLCIPCIVRRASIIGGGIPDQTPYLATTLSGAALTTLLANRSEDTAAVHQATLNGVGEDDLLTVGPWPPSYDLDATLRLCNDGLEEMAHVPIP